jgi:hypothetical protein
MLRNCPDTKHQEKIFSTIFKSIAEVARNERKSPKVKNANKHKGKKQEQRLS